MRPSFEAVAVRPPLGEVATMRRAFEAYQYVAPAVLTPLAAWLWWRHYDGQTALAAIAVLVPVAHAYIVPGIGTNVLRVWEFDARLRLGRFRPHHGFVFGSATAILMLATVGTPSPHPTATDILQSGFVAALILGVVNFVYDALALRAGILKVYNEPWARGRGPWLTAADYAPWFFGGFGFIYGAGLKLAEGALLAQGNAAHAFAVALGLLAATVVLPTLGYVLQSFVRHGHHGCRPVARAPPFDPTSRPLIPAQAGIQEPVVPGAQSVARSSPPARGRADKAQRPHVETRARVGE